MGLVANKSGMQRIWHPSQEYFLKGLWHGPAFWAYSMCLISRSAVSSEWSNLNNVVHKMCLQLASNRASVLIYAVLFCRTSLHCDLISINLFYKMCLFFTVSANSLGAMYFSMCHTTQLDQSHLDNSENCKRAANKTRQKDSPQLCSEGPPLHDHSDSCVGVVEVTNEKLVSLVSLSELADIMSCVLPWWNCLSVIVDY